MAARGVTTSYRSSDGLTTRQMGLRLRNGPMHDDLDLDVPLNEIARIVRDLQNVAKEIEAETRYENDFKNDMRRLCRSMVRDDIMHVILFALFCRFLVYLWS